MRTHAEFTAAGHSTTPHVLLSYEKQGFKFGRFTVMGKYKTRKASYSCRCQCGAYEFRSERAMLNPLNRDDCCLRCQEIARPKHDERRASKRAAWLVMLEKEKQKNDR